MNRYKLNPKIFRQCLAESGYKGISDFTTQHHIHRNTIHNLLRGKNVLSNAFDKIATALKRDPLDLLIPLSTFSSNIPDIDEIRHIISFLAKVDKQLAITLIGSRTTKFFHRYSDWDIGITRFPNPLTGREFLRLKDKVDDLSEDIPRHVDFVNLDQAPVWFLEGFDIKPIFLDGNKDAFFYFIGVIHGIQKEKIA